GMGNDKLFAGMGNDLLTAGEGNDWLYGGAGNDTLHGGMGNDKLFAGMGNDLLIAGEGNDWLYGGAGDDTLHGGMGNDKLFAGMGNDMLISFRDNSNDTFRGGRGSDTFAFIPGQDGTSIGNDLIKDFSIRQKDRIAIGGADTSIKINHIDNNGNGHADATLILLSNSHGDSLGSIKVAGNLLEESSIELTGLASYESALISESVEL
ncbi:MAG TPA: calcium-binding protein, partial [Chlorobaculum parvum]|nr:calcium-binding protein [Chlorobaculum parvum]